MDGNLAMANDIVHETEKQNQLKYENHIMQTQTAIEKVNPAEFGLDETKANDLTKNLHAILKEREIFIGEYEKIILLEITRENVPAFKDLRIKIRDNRTKGIEVWHKANKEFFLSGGRFIDAIKNKESVLNKQMEEKLEEAEKWEQIQEEKRIDALKAERETTLQQYEVDCSLIQVGQMTEDVWNNYLSGVKLNYENKKEEERKAQELAAEVARLDNLERERVLEIAPYAQFVDGYPELRTMNDAAYAELIRGCQQAKIDYDEEQARVREENERLKKEAEEKEAALLAERAKADAESKKAKEESDKAIKEAKDKADALAAELKAKADAEEEERKKEAAALKKAQAAPDKTKLSELSKQIRDMQFPDMKTNEAKLLLSNVRALLAKTADYINEKSSAL